MSCKSNKIGFATKQDACSYVKGMRKGKSLGMKGLNIYQCFCGEFHFTSQTKVEHRRKLKRFARINRSLKRKHNDTKK